METVSEQPVIGNRLSETILLALKTTALVLTVVIMLSVIFNIPLYLLRFALLAPLGFTALSFLDTLLFSYLGANIVFLLALRNYLSGCGEELVWKYFPVGLT